MKVSVHEVKKGDTTKPNWADFQVSSPSPEIVEDNPTITRVVLADDHARVRLGLRTLLERNPDIIVVGEAKDGLEALELVEELEPDVLLLDIEMPRLNGPQVVLRLKEIQSPVRVLALSAHDDRQYVLGMLDNGASGYLTKEEAPEVLVMAVRGVARGERGWISSRVARKMEAWKQETLDRNLFTSREAEILRLLQAGRADPQIANDLDISESTVARHLRMLCLKFQVNTRAELSDRIKDEEI